MNLCNLTDSITNLSNSLISLDVKSGLDSAKSIVIDYAKYAVNDVIIPIIMVVLAGVLIFAVVRFVQTKKAGESYSEYIKGAIVVLVVMVLVGSAPLWIWNMVS